MKNNIEKDEIEEEEEEEKSELDLFIEKTINAWKENKNYKILNIFDSILGLLNESLSNDKIKLNEDHLIILKDKPTKGNTLFHDFRSFRKNRI
jgi:hypothetical protein